MLSMNELLKGAILSDQSQEIQDNMAVLLDRVNTIRADWGKPITVTSGLRTMADHIRIYQDKAAELGHPFELNKVPMHSKHLIGAAVDIYDPDLSLTSWLKENNSQRLEDAQLWCEEGNKNWVHFQIFPPGSGARWFLP